MSTAAVKPASAPPIGTSPTAMMARVARRWRGADSALIATTFGSRVSVSRASFASVHTPAPPPSRKSWIQLIGVPAVDSQ